MKEIDAADPCLNDDLLSTIECQHLCACCTLWESAGLLQASQEMLVQDWLPGTPITSQMCAHCKSMCAS